MSGGGWNTMGDDFLSPRKASHPNLFIFFINRQKHLFHFVPHDENLHFLLLLLPICFSTLVNT